MTSTNLNSVLESSLLTQLSLEEKLYKVLEQQLSLQDLHDYPEVTAVLSKIKNSLEQHYARLNLVLNTINAQIEAADALRDGSQEQEEESANGRSKRIFRDKVSQMLHDDYTALNIAAIGNTFVHTTALAADAQDIADVALQHLTNLTRFVVELSELVPKVVAQELLGQSPEKISAVGEQAAKNIRRAWREWEEVVKNAKQNSQE